MAFKDLREFITFLEKKGDLRRITQQVSRDLEITEITDRVVKSDGPALLFENVDGYEIPLAINLFGTHQRMAWALGVEDIDEISNRVKDLLEMAKAGTPDGITGKLKALGEIVGIAKTKPKLVSKAPCQEVVITGADVDLESLPTLKCWPEDAGRFIPLPLVISHDPETGSRNVGTYRMQVYDRKTTGMHWQSHRNAARHFREGEAREDHRLDVAVALGGDPVTIWAGSMPLPPGIDEIMVAGILRQQAVEMVKCKTSDLEVPAHAEIVLEGYVVPGENRSEGPFGDHTGYYSLEDSYPVFHIEAITHRREPIYPTTIVGRPPTEDYFMGHASERVMLPALQMTVPEIVDYNMPAEGIFTNYVLVSVKKEYPGHVQKVMYALWGLGQMSLVKAIVVFDEHVDVHDLSEIAWRLGANVDPRRDIIFVDGPIDDLDHASSNPRYGSKIGIDATAKTEIEGRSREWPPEIMMTDEIKELVDSKWPSYGI